MVNLARLIGPAIAGVLITLVGEGVCFLLNTVSFIPVIASLLLMKIEPRAIAIKEKNIWKGFTESYKYLKTRPDLGLMILLMACISFAVMPFLTMMPIFAKDIFKGDATTLSWLESSIGLGALFGAIYLAGAQNIKNLSKLVIFSIFTSSLSLVFFSFSPWFVMALFFLMITGLGQMIQISGSNSFIQTQVDEQMRGRVISYYAMAFQGMMPIGSFIAGFSANHIGAPLTTLIQGLLGLITAGIFYLLLKKVRLKMVNKERLEIRSLPGFNFDVEA
jgi:predicted MFS family arabinose efflux permease